MPDARVQRVDEFRADALELKVLQHLAGACSLMTLQEIRGDLASHRRARQARQREQRGGD